jgi:hypothetical protein
MIQQVIADLELFFNRSFAKFEEVVKALPPDDSLIEFDSHDIAANGNIQILRFDPRDCGFHIHVVFVLKNIHCQLAFVRVVRGDENAQ